MRLFRRTMRSSSPSITAAALLVAAVSACTAAAAAPRAAAMHPAPAAADRLPPAAVARADTSRPYAPADVRFMQGMIGHHGQALVMTALVPTHGARAEVRLLAERIEASQRSEIAQMQQWLRARGEDVPAADAHHHGAGGDHALMPGMLTDEELARLAAAQGAEFDRLFLEFMIRHHEGALTMVAGLFGTNGAGQEPEIFRLASDVESDQQAEIARMRALLGALAPQ